MLSVAPMNEKRFFSAHLMDQLDRISRYPMTVVTAPSGMGKTTAVREYVSKAFLDRAYWYTCYGESGQAAWNRICEQLKQIDVSVADSLCVLGFPHRETLSEHGMVISRIQCDVPSALIIDNYHLLRSDVSYKLMLAYSQHGCPNFHIIIITQPLGESLGEPLSAADVHWIDTKALLFSRRDVAAYFKVSGYPLTEADLGQVMWHTSGWVSAVRLHLLNYQQTGTIRRVSDIDLLLDEVVWRPLGDEERRLLLVLGIFGHASERQICLAMDYDELPGWAVELMNRMVLVKRDEGDGRYYLHNLLSTFLMNKLRELPDPQRREYSVNAGRVHLIAHHNRSAIEAFLDAREPEQALDVPLRSLDLSDCDADQLDDLLDRLFAACGEEMLLKKPRILLVFASELFLRGHTGRGRLCREIIERALRPDGHLDPAEARYIDGELCFLRAWDQFNDIDAMGKWYRVALEALGGASKVLDFHDTWAFGWPSMLFYYCRDGQRLTKTLDSVAEWQPVLAQLTEGQATGVAAMLRGEALLGAGQDALAEQMTCQAAYQASTQKAKIIRFCAELNLTRIAILRGDVGGFRAQMKKLDECTKMDSDISWRRMCDMGRAQIALALGKADEVPEWLRNETNIQRLTYGQNVSFGMLLLGKWMLISGKHNKLLGIASVVTQAADALHMALMKLYCLIYMACAHMETGGRSEAYALLERALNVAEPGEVYLPFAEHADWLMEPLKTMRQQGLYGDAIERILALCARQKVGVRTICGETEQNPDELTRREREIAMLARDGLTNKQISGRLSITPETVKDAMKTIFQKLDIHSRHQIADRNF